MRVFFIVFFIFLNFIFGLNSSYAQNDNSFLTSYSSSSDHDPDLIDPFNEDLDDDKGENFDVFREIDKKKNEDNDEKERLENERIKSIGLNCISYHKNLERHIHPFIFVDVDGEREEIPADIGITWSCMAEMHTHSNKGKIHIESLEKDKKFKVNQWMDLWGKELKRSGYFGRFYIDGVSFSYEEFLNHELKDGEVLYLEYESSVYFIKKRIINIGNNILNLFKIFFAK